MFVVEEKTTYEVILQILIYWKSVTKIYYKNLTWHISFEIYKSSDIARLLYPYRLYLLYIRLYPSCIWI